MEFAQLITVAVLVEAIWENIKMIWQNGKLSIDRIGSLVIGILVCLLVNIDIFTIVQLPVNIPIVGCVLTGIIVSRGANFLHDLISKLTTKKGE